ncbi:sensor histidine kinase [Pedobacter psychroterrae]|uniref:histidine kinase n=1 Tax=Pedobacter psychroterrae TaxID=2530453 RepID=A0A4R0NLJ0_9SPHI|nr:7TM diverse intracellular signaling domain-containing protein [Pedobacter psychroterrae]TCD01049.1 GHKL domain-containing protein [Pedobacter psychroterrae]
MSKKWLLIIFLSINISTVLCADIVIKKNDNKVTDARLNIGTELYYYKDKTNILKVDEVATRTDFVKSEKSVLNFGVHDYSIWIKFSVKNDSDNADLTLQIEQPQLDEIALYRKTNTGYEVTKAGEKLDFKERAYNDPSYIFKLKVLPGTKGDYFLRIQSSDNMQLPIFLGTEKVILESAKSKYLISGLYLGIMISMLLYNLFIYFTVRDNNYLYYVVYLTVVILTQAGLQGFTFQYLWPDSSTMAIYSSFIFPALVGITALQFERHFLRTKEWLPRTDKFAIIFILLYVSAVILAFFSKFTIALNMIDIIASATSLYMLYMAIKISIKGYRPATFFLVSWSVFLVGVVVFILKNFGILPYNNFTNYTMPFGSALEVTLLSFALADKINIFKKEKEESQAEALRVSLENEKLILEQNVELERKVNERTLELQESNSVLEVTLTDLKEAQSQLVDAEKMAGLGQLTAGIAHEINNPINFVTSNIKPLELDIIDLNSVIDMYEKLDLNDDLRPQISKIESYKKQIDIEFVREEIKSLLSGIGEGAKRTAEIIRSLKNFSRLDENDTKPVDLNEGLESTLVLVKSTFPDHMKLDKDFGNIPKVECLPGKINQVFMNLITNAIHAIKSMPQAGEGTLSIKTWAEDNHVKISIKDTGTGMPEEVKQRIFEPFFTTKDVGEGTGLGLSIVFRIIENHHGNIDVITKVNKGTEFIITLPVNSQ